MKTIQGKALRTGVAIGRLFKLSPRREIHPRHSDDPAGEVKKLQEAVARLQEKMTGEIAAADKTLGEILTAQRLMLEDTSYREAIEQAIRQEHYAAEYAVILWGQRLAAEVSQLENEYLRARAEDIRQVSERLADTILGAADQRLPDEPVILAAEEFTPAQLSALDHSKLLGLVALHGSPVSHTAIIATNYGIPFLSGIDPEETESDITAIVDGETGRLILSPGETETRWAREKMAAEKALMDSAPPTTKMKVCCNISTPEDIDEALAHNADGIGLFRTEFLFMNRDAAPDEEEQLRIYRTALEKMGGRTVVIRTIDVGTDKPVSYLQLPKEENPQLGLRGVRISLKRPELFRVQLRALLRAAAYGQLGIMFPMITSAKEVTAIREQVKLAEAELTKAGKSFGRPKLGIMIETPAAALISGELAPLVDFFSIGTNDLIQYTLALDRQGEGLDDFYDPYHEAIFKLIEATVKGAHAHGIPVRICGELGADVKALPRLVKLGLDEVSVGAAVISRTRNIIARCESAKESSQESSKEQLSTPQTLEGSSLTLVSPADGIIIPMAEIPDEKFSTGAIGPCFALEPSSGTICAPADGQVETIAANAVIIRTKAGRRVLVQVGLDTDKLKGIPITLMVKEGQAVQKGDALLEADLKAIKASGCSVITPVVLLED